MHRINSVSQQVMKIRLLSETRCIYIATLYQVMDLVGSDPNPNTSASGHFNSPDIDFNVQLSDDTMHTAYPEDIPNLLPPSQGPSLYWGWSDSDSQCSSLVPDSEINIEEQLLINTPDSLKARNDGWVRARPDVSSTVLLWTRDMTRPKGIATEKKFLCSRGESWAGLWSG